MASRWSGTAWGAAEQITTGSVAITSPQLTATINDIIQVVWRASDGTSESLFARAFYSGAWSSTATIDASTDPVGQFHIDTDNWGDTNITWVDGNDIFVNWGGNDHGWAGAQVEVLGPSPISQYAYSDHSG